MRFVKRALSRFGGAGVGRRSADETQQATARTRSSRAKSQTLVLFAVSVGGYAWAAIVASNFYTNGGLLDPSGSDVGRVFVAAGEAFRAGRPVYTFGGEPFFYAPPVVLAFALFSLLPYPVCFWTVVGANFAALRYLAGSWRGVGYTFWIVPFVPFLPWAGTLDLPMAAVIVLAIRRGHVALPVFFGFMKFSPLLAIDPGRWRRTVLLVALGCLVTLPFLSLWQEWFAQLGRAVAEPVGPLIPIPFALRLSVGLLFVATRRPVFRAAGAAIATPAFYWHSLVLLLAPLALFWQTAKAGRDLRLGRSNLEDQPVSAPEGTTD
jgi:hypothetical protein